MIFLKNVLSSKIVLELSKGPRQVNSNLFLPFRTQALRQVNSNLFLPFRTYFQVLESQKGQKFHMPHL